jgi:hypothetical protein
MSDETRLAKNEAMFRVVNGEIAKIGERFGGTPPSQFVCECADVECADPIDVPLEALREVRRFPARFVVAKGHAESGIEYIVESQPGYDVVEKIGEAGAVARATADDA